MEKTRTPHRKIFLIYDNGSQSGERVTLEDRSCLKLNLILFVLKWLKEKKLKQFAHLFVRPVLNGCFTFKWVMRNCRLRPLLPTSVGRTRIETAEREVG